MDDPEHPAPAGLGNKADKFFQPLIEACFHVGVPLGLVGKIDNPGFSFDVIHGQEAPVAAVHTIIPVIAHDKTMAGGDDNRAEVIPYRVIIAVIPVLGINLGVVVDLVAFINGLTVDGHLFVFYLDLLAFQGDHPLDKILGKLVWVFENNDVVALDVTAWKNRFLEGELGVGVDELVDKEEITDEKGRLHGSRGNLESLDNKGHDKKDEDRRLGNQLKIFANEAFISLLLFFFHSAPLSEPPNIAKKQNFIKSITLRGKHLRFRDDHGGLQCHERAWAKGEATIDHCRDTYVVQASLDWSREVGGINVSKIRVL